jgi:hypothetical protein
MRVLLAGKNMLFVKGAPERVIERCTTARMPDGSKVPFTEADKKAVLKNVAEMAARPLRCLAMAIREDVGDLADYDGCATKPSHAGAHAGVTRVPTRAGIPRQRRAFRRTLRALAGERTCCRLLCC